MVYFRIAFRNIIKNYRRAVITMISIVIGMIAMLLTHGFFAWQMNELRESVIHSGIGHYQVYAAGFSKYGADDPYLYLIKNAPGIAKEFQAISGVRLVATRIAFNGILSSGQKSAIVTGEAGRPENEQHFAKPNLIHGRPLSVKKPNGIIIGAGVAKQLSAQIGDTLTLMGNAKGGGINAVDLDVVGITRSGIPDLDNVSAQAQLNTVQNLLSIDTEVQRIVVLLKNTEDMRRVQPKIAALCQKYHLEYKGWEDLAAFYQSLKLMYNAVFMIIIIIVLVIVTFTVSNTVNMNLNERVREIGTMRALGTRRSQIALIFIIESLLLGICGGIIGIIISYLFIGCTELIGGLPVLLTGSDQTTTLLRVFFHPEIWAVAGCLLLFTMVAVAASIIPARRASDISITDALRWI